MKDVKRLACERRMSRAGKLIEAAVSTEKTAKQMLTLAIAEFGEARRELEGAKVSRSRAAK